ncbi:MAG: SUMF1/EgtB/PvdO family nonheme iron enzyme [Planctomycetota bacterium]
MNSREPLAEADVNPDERTEAAPESGDDDASARFARFLERHHDGGGDLEALCAEHPEQASRFRAWWRLLESAGEVRPAPPDGQAFGPHYTLLRELGRGAQGTVWLAEDRRLRRRVALKLLPHGATAAPDALRRFLREAEVASRLEHPGICTVFDSGACDGQAFIAMRFVQGETLAARIARARQAGSPLDVGTLLPFFEQAALALHAAHEAGLVHRDVKPGNLMVATNGAPVILDFGLARYVEGEVELTRSHEIIGTPVYMAPEQVAGGKALDRRCDVYALGAVLFECLTLRRPFEGPTQEALFRQILTASLPDPRQWGVRLPRDLVVVLHTALARERSERYATAAALAEDLRCVRVHAPISARPVPRLRRLWKWARRHPATATSVLLTLASLAGGTTVSTWAWLRERAAQDAYRQLADARLLREQLDAEASLYPGRPDRVPAMEAWLQKAYPLRDRLPLHRARLAALRGEALPYTEEEAARDRAQNRAAARLGELEQRLAQQQRLARVARQRGTRQVMEYEAAATGRQIATLRDRGDQRLTFHFESLEQRFLHDELTRLVADLEAFATTVARVEERLALVEETGTPQDLEARWAAAVAAVQGNARYDGHRLSRQVDLVPLGDDPRSGLAEFALLGTGLVPQRGEGGDLACGPDTAVVLVLLPGGRCICGAQADNPQAPNYDPAAEPMEGPPHEFFLEGFLMGKFELSRAQWMHLGGSARVSRAVVAASHGVDESHPMTDVSWVTANEVLQRCGLQLPTEAQWEYAARGGSSTAYFTGDNARGLEGHVNCRVRAPYASADHYLFTAPVASMRPNPFGLHHVFGNAAEWCRDGVLLESSDRFEYRAGDGERVTPGEIETYAVRGGSFLSLARQLRSAARGMREGTNRFVDVGIRVVRPLDWPKARDR